MAAKRVKKTYSPAEKRRRNRRFNTILYIAAALLMISGILLIVSDQTLLFPTIINEVENRVQEISSGEKTVFPTVPPLQMFTFDPNTTFPPRDYVEENPFLNRPHRETPEPTLAPGVTPDPNATPRPTRDPNAPTQDPNYPRPTNQPVYAYAPKNVYFLDDYIQNSISNIICPVDPVGYNANGQMDTVRSAFRAGWFMYGGDPVRGGNTLIAGHNRYSGRLGYFSVIKDKMLPGDIVIVEMQNGEYAYYAVDTITEYPYDAVPDSVMNIYGRPRLTLITCLGDYSSVIHTSRHRVIAVCYPVYFGENNGTGSGQPEATPEPVITSEPVITPEPAVTPVPEGGDSGKNTPAP